MKGIVYNSFGNMRLEPSHSSELVSQVMMGMVVNIIKQNEDGWKYIESPDKYTGWIIGSIKIINNEEFEKYSSAKKGIVKSLYAISHTTADTNSPIISDLVLGNILIITEDIDNFYKVEYPDKRDAYISKSNMDELSNWNKKKSLTQESIVSFSKQFIGIPYLWGGTTSKGLDCSGFVQTVFAYHNIQLPRDASQQIKQGKPILSEFKHLKPADLLFFGKIENGNEKISHVAIYIGNNEFIHASDYIKIGSFDEASLLFDEYNKNRYIQAARIL